MTIEQLNYLLREELYAIKNHKDNIDRIKKEYFDSNYGLKEGDKNCHGRQGMVLRMLFLAKHVRQTQRRSGMG